MRPAGGMTPMVRAVLAAAAAVALHGAALAVTESLVPASGAGALFWIDMTGARAGVPADADDEVASDDWDEFGERDSGVAFDEPVTVVFVAPPPPQLGDPPIAVSATGESAALARSHPMPDATVDVAGVRGAARGGEAEPGAHAWTGRDDREDKRAQIWSDARRYQLPRRRTGQVRRSDESIVRAPQRAFHDRYREKRRRARTGQNEWAPAHADGRDDGSAEIADTASIEADAYAARAPRPTRVVGVLVPVEASPLVALGVAAVEAARDGAVVDNVDSIASSDETHPAPFEMTRLAAGGDQRKPGVRGTGGGAGAGGRATRRDAGTAAVRAKADRGAPDLAVQAWRTDPYFRTLYSRLDAQVRYPRELALSLEQGEVVVRFTLYADGRVAGIRVEKSSGYQQFDQQVTRAIGRAAPFGPVPAEILGERPAIAVRAPYAFRNPWIR